ncbi:MAG: TonB-dependent receptor [Pseudomonadota bacterium]
MPKATKYQFSKMVIGAAASSMAILATSHVAIAQHTDRGASAETPVSLPAGPLNRSILAISNVFDVDILAANDLLVGKTAPGISSATSVETALTLVLAETGLTYTSSDGAFVIVTQTAEVEQVEQPSRTVLDAPAEPDEPMFADTIIVTGTNIRGATPESSPFRVFDRNDLILTGQRSAQDFMRTIPQNFAGGSSDLVTSDVPSDRNSSFNGFSEGALGSGVNLRGLGAGATLVLLNGHRLPPGSAVGDFVDISFIPTTAVERVEVLLDGGASIYGSDAVAGVTNFILRDEVDGIEGSFRYATPTRGGYDEYRASVSAGHSWETGSLAASYEYSDRGRLTTRERDFTRALAENGDSNLLPGQERHSVTAAIKQELSQTVLFNADFLYGERNAGIVTTGPFQTITAAPATDILSIAAGIEWGIDDNWTLNVNGTAGQTTTQSNRVDTFFDLDRPPTRLENDVTSELYTADVVLSGRLFSIPGGDVAVALGGQLRREELESFDLVAEEIARAADRDVYAGFIEATVPLFGEGNRVPGFERLELTASARIEDYSDFGSTTDPKVGVLWQPVESVRLRATYSTSFAAPALGLVGARDLGAVTLPLSALNDFFGLEVDPAIADVVAVTVFGTGEGLGPETSETLTIGSEFEHHWGGGRLFASLNWFDIDFEDRINTVPIPGFFTPFAASIFEFENPGILPTGTVIFDPTPEQIQAAIDSFETPTFEFGADTLDAGVLNFAGVSRNLTQTSVSGFDVAVNTEFDMPQGAIRLGFDATYLTTFENAATPSSAPVDVVGTLFNPSELRARGQIGFNSDKLAANLFVNYVDSFRTTDDPSSARIDDQTTFDLSLTYRFASEHSASALNDLAIGVFLINAFDDDPPFAEAPIDTIGLNYDPTNASPVGRAIAFEISKQF